jgi:tripartite-type tricarboxylate transporter receptor subunit TctC
VNSVKELIVLAKQKPGELSYGSLGEGSVGHLVGKTFEKAAGIQLLQVPFRGSAPVIIALTGNQISMAFANLPEVMPLVKTGKLKALAIATPQRSALAPGLPTVAEAGFRGFTSESWYGFLVPAGTPGALVSRLQKEVARALALPEVKERLSELGIIPGGGTPDEFAALLRDQMATAAAVAKEANIVAAD